MKKKAIIIVIIAMLLLGMLACLLWPRVVQLEECSEVYRRYEGLEGIDAAYIKNYRVNDTLTLPVTLLEATTDSGWARLQKDFGVPEIPKEYEDLFYADSNQVSVKKYVNPENPLDTQSNDLVATSRYKRAICYFEIQNKEQREIMLNKLIKDNMKINNYEQVN
jgi:hypothetical protein